MRSNSRFTPSQGAVNDTMDDGDFNARRMIKRALTREQFGKRVFDLMLERDWNQAELARQAGVTRDSISKYIRGTYMPDAVNLKKLADAFQVKPEDLLPNVSMNELAMRSEPALEIRTGADPTTSWVKINRLISTAGLSELLAVLDKYSATAE